MNTINMRNIGLTEGFIREAQAYEGMTIGRVSSQYKGLYKVITEEGELLAEVSGKFRHKAVALSQYPAVGDFVMLDRAEGSVGNGVIHHVLMRKSVFSRKVAGTSQDAQVVAANIDTVFICMALNSDFNLRRLERYLSIAWDSGAIPVVVLTKADLCQDVQQRLDQVSGVAIGVDVLVTTSLTEDGYLPIKSYISSGCTVAFIGSSGVGKSTLINRLIGEDLLATNDIRDDGRGRHTTTRRELMLVPEGGVVIDTPGMREIGIISADLSKSFADINEIAAGCRFDDCTHQNEPGCAVIKAVEDGILAADRFESFRKLAKEARYDGLNSKMIEREKINNMFGGMGAMKNARRYAKEKNKRK